MCEVARRPTSVLSIAVAHHVTGLFLWIDLLFFSLMIQKLLSVVGGKCMADSVDSPMNQEALLGGHLFLIVLKVQT